MKKTMVIILGMLLISLLAACSETSHEPVDISQDTDQCYFCHMGVEDLGAATQVILEDGTPRVFDDIGCMLMYFKDTNDEISISYVVDYDSGEWLDLDDATFVHDNEIETPMSYGFIAFASEQEADNYMEEKDHTEKLSSEELQAINTSELEDWYRAHDAEQHGHGDEHEDEEHS